MADRNLTDNEVYGTLVNALHTAAVHYRTCHDLSVSEARKHEGDVQRGHMRVADQFAIQAQQADALADLFEQAEAVIVREGEAD